MKDNIVKVILFLLIIILIYAMKINNTDEFIVTDNDELYDVAINYLQEEDIKQDIPEKIYPGYHTFYSYDKFGITEDNEYIYAYMWVLSEDYYLKENEVTSGSASSLFYKFTFKDNKVVKYDIPQDGSNYKESIKKLCIIITIYNKVINYDSKLSNEKQINDYYNLLEESRNIKKNDIVSDNGLLFSISWKNTECVTELLSVYSNKTYELYTDYQSCKNGQLCNDILKYTKKDIGKYDYDVIKIINNSIISDEMTFNSYNLPEFEIYTGNVDKLHMMITDSNNKYLKEFLESIDVDLHKCANPDYKE